MTRLAAQLIGTLLLVAFVLHFLWWLLAAAAISATVWIAVRGHRSRQAEIAAIAARADQEHRWVLAGDERGVYGRYPPAAA